MLFNTEFKSQDATKPASSGSGTSNKMWLSGNVGFGTDNTKDGETNSNWNFGPSFGYFLNDKMAVGIGVDFSGSTSKRNDTKNEIRKSSGWEISPFFRYYFAGAGNFRFFGEAYLGFGGGKNRELQRKQRDKQETQGGGGMF